MAKVSRTYRIEQETADRITEIAENENMTATEVVEDAIRAYSSEKYVENTANQVGSADSPALAALRREADRNNVHLKIEDFDNAEND